VEAVVITRIVRIVFLAMFFIESLIAGQATDAKKILSDIRAALGGEQNVAALKTTAIEGQSSRVRPDGSTVAQDLWAPTPRPSRWRTEEAATGDGAPGVCALCDRRSR